MKTVQKNDIKAKKRKKEEEKKKREAKQQQRKEQLLALQEQHQIGGKDRSPADEGYQLVSISLSLWMRVLLTANRKKMSM